MAKTETIWKYVVRVLIHTTIGLLFIYGMWRFINWLWPGAWTNYVIISLYMVDVALIISGICPKGFVDVYRKLKGER